MINEINVRYDMGEKKLTMKMLISRINYRFEEFLDKIDHIPDCTLTGTL